MSRSDVIAGLDVGSHSIKTVIVQLLGSDELPRVIGMSTVRSRGIRKGKVIDVEEVTNSINKSLEEAERMAGVAVGDAVISVGGAHISTESSKGVVAVGRADGEVTVDDVSRVINAAQAISVPVNNEILHVIPKSYSLDDHVGIKDPVGMNGVRLEVEALIIEGSAPEIRNVAKSINMASVEVRDFVLAPLATAEAVLSKEQKELGVVAIDLGAGTTGIAVYEEGDLLHAAVLPVGAGHITNDIAIGLRTTIDIAEKVKQEFGNAVSEEVGKKEEIDLGKVDASEEGIVSRYHVSEIIEARLEEIFKLVEKELRFIGKNGLLPAGAVLAGGGAKLVGVADLAKKCLGLPVQLGYPKKLGGVINRVDDTTFACPLGLVFWELNQGESPSAPGRKKAIVSSVASGVKGTVGHLKNWFDKFMP